MTNANAFLKYPGGVGRRLSRRDFIALSDGRKRCLVKGKKHTANKRLLSAREVTAWRHLLSGQDRLPEFDPIRYQIGQVRRIVDGQDVCYILFCAATCLVKIGTSTEFERRWRRIESAVGVPLQPLAVLVGNGAERERELHRRFSTSRQLGEWFAAAPVVRWLRETYKLSGGTPAEKLELQGGHSQ